MFPSTGLLPDLHWLQLEINHATHQYNDGQFGSERQ